MTRQILVVMTRQIRVMTRHLTTKYAYNTPKNAYYTRTKKKFFFQFLTQIGNSYFQKSDNDDAFFLTRT